MSEKEKIIIFDTTLRDGEQSPGASLDIPEKLEVARQLSRLNVDVIEAGFPIASPGDFEAVKLVAGKVRGPVICGLARSIKGDIDAAARALKPARHPRIHVFLATSPIHRKYKLQKAEGEILRLAVEAVKYARRHCADVEFSPEDASRTERDFLCQVVEAVIAAGAGTVNIPDTVGYAYPEEFGEVIADLRNRVPNIGRAVISVHCHDDLGMAVANSLAALKNGARQVECTINGIGERAGNASLEEIVMAISTRADLLPFATGVEKKLLYPTSRLVSHRTGIPVQPNKAVVGQNAFAHESGIHQDGVLKKRSTYEIMRPQDVGFGESRLVMGKHSGRHAFSERLRKLGMNLSPKEIEQAFGRFKRLADKKKEVFDEDLVAVVADELERIPPTWQLEYFHVTSGSETTPTATVRLKGRGKVFQDAACGDGPVDACYKTIERITGIRTRLLEYSLGAVSPGKEAVGEVTVKIESGADTVSGRGASTDIIEASVKAYVNAINRLLHLRTIKNSRPRKAIGRMCA